MKTLNMGEKIDEYRKLEKENEICPGDAVWAPY